MPEFDGLPLRGWRAERKTRHRGAVWFQRLLSTHGGKSVFRHRWREGIESVQVTKVGRTYPFSITQEQFSIEGRGLVARSDIGRLPRQIMSSRKKFRERKNCRIRRRAIYTHPPLTAPQQWGMSIDLNVCTGVVRV